ncbi:hypothetical protein [Mesorhizobium sp. B2-4-7]|uniref:hypothetical protein n=1 Tax=Mesorhizobium sp. B2-4-7 TaxID=2589942 RepID=UPI00112B2558|nr:hypothetical protein [Mesorhizobium sp. B2-4-7]TPL30168.1 hypothetical protein FJ946_02565 [Mesorhizobium sp. B2-4-7]
MTSIYDTGTVTVTNGSAAVVGTDTGWAVSLVKGGTLYVEAPGNPMPIDVVTDDTHLTGAVKWTGADGTYNYAIVRESSDAASVVDLYDKLSRVLVTLSLAGIHPNASGTIAERNAITLSTSDEGFLFLHAEIGVAFAFYRWTGTAWEGPFELKGDQGPRGAPGLGVGGYGLPPGGVTGQFLRKSSDADGETDWETVDTDAFIAGPDAAADNALARFDGTTGKQTQASTSHLSDTGVLRLGSTSAPGAEVFGVHAGPGAPATTGITFLAAQAVTADRTGGYHPFSDDSTYNVPTAGGTAAASFDATVAVGGTQDYNHFAGLQWRTTYGSTGTLANMYGHVDLPAITAGTITNRFGSSIWDITKLGGTVVNNYGHYVKQLSNGTNNWAFYSEGTTKSFIGGITFDGVGGLTGLTSQNTGPLAGFRNVLINGAMMVSQRGTSYTSTGSLNNSGNYTLDRWKLLSDGNNIANVSQSTSVIPTNGLNSLLVLTATAAKKFGFLQIIEQKNLIGLLGKTVTLSFEASQGANLAGYKAAVLAWTGTADAPTNPISAWNADGTIPTFAANWTLENNVAPVAVAANAAAFTRFSVAATLDTASTKNLAVFIWCDDPAAATTGDPWAVTDVQLEIGAVGTPFERRPWETELNLCKAFFQKSFPYATAPAEGVLAHWKPGFGWSTTAIGVGFMPFSTTMRVAPTLTFYKPGGGVTGTNGRWQWYDGVSSYQDSSATAVATTVSQEGFDVNLTVVGAAAKSAYIVQGHWTASAEL